MNHKLSVIFSRKLVQLGAIPKEHEDVYIYGFELIFSFIFIVLHCVLCKMPDCYR